MIKMINLLYGTEMWVAENRVEEYMAAGHKLAASDSKPAENPIKKPAASKKSTKK